MKASKYGSSRTQDGSLEAFRTSPATIQAGPPSIVAGPSSPDRESNSSVAQCRSAETCGSVARGPGGGLR